MNILITICARGGSKGIPDKNIRPLNDIPLIGYTIKTAQKFKAIHPHCDIALSTDSQAIKDAASLFNLQTTYFRPKFLATDQAGKMDVIKDILQFEEQKTGKTYDYLIDLDVTSPLRTIEDLNESLKIMENNPETLNLFSVSPAHRNPYFNMVEEKQEGYFGLIKPLDSNFLTRQSAPKVYDMNASFYFYRKAFFQQNHKSCLTPFSKIFEMPHLCFDLDTPLDFEFMEFLFQNNKLDFSI